MTQEKFDKFFARHNEQTIKRDINNANEFDDEHVDIVVSVLTDEHEYGYGRDADFRYYSVDDFIKLVKDDILEEYNLEDINRIELSLDFWSDDNPDDISTIDLDETE